MGKRSRGYEEACKLKMETLFPQERDRLRMIAKAAQPPMIDTPAAPGWFQSLENHIAQAIDITGAGKK
jgi:hypothetical protein